MVGNDEKLDFHETDVVVIGGGPGGSTAATLLRQRGWNVVVLDRDKHPRFHIGESLLPMNLALFERLGVLAQVAAIGVPKYGAEFGSALYPHKRTTYFRRAFQAQYPYAFQVWRADLDHLLLQHSRSHGVAVHEGVTVKDVELRPGDAQILAVDERGEPRRWRARFIVDASGREALLARKLGWQRADPRHRSSAALFGHFHGVERLPEPDAGNISVYWFPHGWFWLIPLRGGVMSVGAVCRPEYLKTRAARSQEQFLWDTIALCPDAQRRMCGAELCRPVQATGNYSYRAARMRDTHFVLIGDAYAFIDPVFSTGVYLAMRGAELAAPAIDAWLRDDQRAEGLWHRFERQVRTNISVVSWFIYRFTSPALHHLFMNPKNLFGVERAMVSMLAGDFDNPRCRVPLALFKAIYGLQTLRARPSPDAGLAASSPIKFIDWRF